MVLVMEGVQLESDREGQLWPGHEGSITHGVPSCRQKRKDWAAKDAQAARRDSGCVAISISASEWLN